jgi:hypothetical protein
MPAEQLDGTNESMKMKQPKNSQQLDGTTESMKMKTTKK